jgi:DNA-binding protein YbaB
VADEQFAELAQFRDELDVQAQKLEAAFKKAAGSFTGVDGTESVQVTLTEAGKVTGVTVAQDWADHLDADTLGAAVLEAVHAAQAAYLEELTVAADEQEAAPPPPVRPLPVPSEGLAQQLQDLASGPMNSDELQAGMVELLGLLQAVNDSVDQVQAQVVAFTKGEHTARSRSGHARATVNGRGDILRIDYDKRWLVNAHEYNISRETQDACDAAYGKISEHGVKDLIASSPLGQVAALGQDPQELARRLRIRRDY